MKWPCFYGIDFASPQELIANTVEQDDPVARICEEIGADSLAYVSTEAMVEASRQPYDELCAACFDGNFPLGMPTNNPNTGLVRAMQRQNGSCENAEPLEEFVEQ